MMDIVLPDQVDHIDRMEYITACVDHVFNVEETTYGDPQHGLNFIVRYRGRLSSEDSVAAFDRLHTSLQQAGATPLFRNDGERQAIIIIPAFPKPKPSNPAVNLVMLILTILSVLFTGSIYGMAEMPNTVWGWVSGIFIYGWPFALSMLAILLAHEFGHYLMGRHHKVHVTLPYLIPMPFSPFGTMGAFINMKEIPRNRRQLLDIGIAGPLAGLVVAIPVLLLGLWLSKLDVLPLMASDQVSLQMEGNSILYLLAKLTIFGRILPAPLSFGGIPPLFYYLRFFFTGQPFPWGGMDVMLHPVAWAGWAGLLITAMNLLPAGQLDGGHVLFVLLGRKIATRLLPVIFIGLILLGFFWNGWWLWAGLIFIFGRAYAEPLDEITQLDGKRKALGVLALVLFVLLFTPVPLNIY